MKHTLKITLLLVFIFFIAQVIGLSITNKYIDHKTTVETGEVTFEALPYNLARPEIEESTSYILIMFVIIIGTLLVLLIIKLRTITLWKIWLSFAVFFTITIVF